MESSGLAEWTKRDYKTILKHFYKWLRNWEDGSPPEVRWIKKSESVENKRPILPKDLLTAEEKTALLNATLNQRDRAFLEVLMESGRRPEEILTMHSQDVEFDEIGAKLFVNGKMGNDTVRIISSSTALAVWLENHPLKKEKDFPPVDRPWALQHAGTDLAFGGPEPLEKDCKAGRFEQKDLLLSLQTIIHGFARHENDL